MALEPEWLQLVDVVLLQRAVHKAVSVYPLKVMRLKKRAEFLNVQQKGQKIRKPAFTFCFVEQAFAVSRIGFTASKKVGNAVVRNKAKRRMRALAFENMQTFLVQHRVDVVLIAHPQLPDYSYAHLTRDLKTAIKDAITRLNHG